MPSVSVVVPVYNVAPYLPGSLDSILCQTFSDFELICVNDGSTDASPEILERYAAQDTRIRILSQENQSAAVARNNGMALARGKYLMFLDPDDFFEPELLEKLFCRAEKYSADLVLCPFRVYDNSSGETTDAPNSLQTQFLQAYSVFSRRDFPDRIMTLTSPAVWHKLFLRSFLEQNGIRFQNLPNCEDILFSMLSLCLAERISWIPDVLINYRANRSDSLEGSRFRHPACFVDALLALFESLHRHGIYEQVEKSYMDRAVKSCTNSLQLLQSSPAALAFAQEVLKRDLFPRTGLLNHPDESYERPDAVRKLRELPEAENPEQLRRRLKMEQERTAKLQERLRNRKWPCRSRWPGAFGRFP